jgi:antitoxin (DNA-binding transcriptional repressor) of toxin-antitoxin stability system
MLSVPLGLVMWSVKDSRPSRPWLRRLTSYATVYGYKVAKSGPDSYADRRGTQRDSARPPATGRPDLPPRSADHTLPGAAIDACSTTCYTAGMGREITQRELRNNSGEIMRKLDQGETFVVTRNGVPVGELTPLRRHRFVAAETAVAMFRNAPPVDYPHFRADLDAWASQDVSPRG